MINSIKENWFKRTSLIMIFVLFFSSIPFNYSSAIISQDTLKSVVRIICVTDEGTWSGSGMIISNNGYILTNKHVVSGDTGDIYTDCSIGITDSEFSEPKFTYTADTIITANGVDLALLKINSTKTDFNYSKVFLYYLPNQGIEIEALGYPIMGGNKITYTKGYVSGVIGSQDDIGNFFIKADLKLDAGNSGGPSFTNQGEFVGINSAVLAGKYNSLGLIIPSTTILDFLRVNSYDHLITGIQKKDNNQSIQFNNYSEPKSTSSQIPSDGSLVRADRNLRTDCPTCPPTVYLIDDGYKRGIGAFAEMTFANCGWKWEDVKVIDASIIESIPTGMNFDNFSLYEEDFPHPYKIGECWIPKDQRIIRKFPNGTLLQVAFKYWPDSGRHTVYLLENGKKRAFVSREVFESLGYRFNEGEAGKWKSNLTSISEEEFYQYPIGETITLDNPPKVATNIPEGAIIRAYNDIDVYIVKYVGLKKFKRLVLSPSVFNNYGHLKWENIIEVDNLTLESFTTSDLVRAVGDDKIYRLYPQGDTGQKRLIKNSSVLTKFGLNPDSIYEINSFDRNSYVTGIVLE